MIKKAFCILLDVIIIMFAVSISMLSMLYIFSALHFTHYAAMASFVGGMVLMACTFTLVINPTINAHRKKAQVTAVTPEINSLSDLLKDHLRRLSVTRAFCELKMQEVMTEMESRALCSKASQKEPLKSSNSPTPAPKSLTQTQKTSSH